MIANPQNTLRHLLRATKLLACIATLQLLAAAAAHASHLPLIFKGYYAVTNAVFVDPADPGHLQVRVGGTGGASQIGSFKVSSSDERMDFATGILTATFVFEDSSGDQITSFCSGPSIQQPDGRVTFSGNATITGGTGRYAKASGVYRWDGWARANPETGTGIGLVTFSGYIRGAAIKPSIPFAAVESLDALVANPTFTSVGNGYATSIGKFRDVNATVASPFNGFVGIVDGKFTAIYAFDSVWTTTCGDELHLTAVETLTFATIILPDGTPVPDLTQASRAKIYQTIIGGTGRYAGMEGVVFANALFTPTGTDENGALVIDGKWSGIGALALKK